MNTIKGLTKIDVLITALCLIILAVNLPVLSAGGKTHAKTDVCKANLMQIITAWNLYADENEDKIPGTYTSKCVCLSGCVYPKLDCTQNPPMPVGGGCNDNPPIKHHSFPSWVEHPHQWNTTTDPALGSKSNPHRYDLLPDGRANSWDFESQYINKERDDKHAIACGTLFKYIKDFKVYACPAGDKGIAVTYVGSDGLNGIQTSGPGQWCNQAPSGAGWSYPSIYIRSQIKKPAERIVFIDIGRRAGCSWNLINTPAMLTPGCWSSTPPVRHNNGATFAFADGHTEYHKWTGRAVVVAKGSCVSAGVCPAPPCAAFTCDKDLFYMAKGVCGGVGGNAPPFTFTPPAGCTIE
jgi:prepilin-type processing-associated H-X9-DG protein